MGKLTKKLQEAVKKLSYNTTVDQLKKKGIQRVNVVGLDRIVALIEAAVHRSLKARMAGLGGIEARGEIADATREEFLKLLHSKDALDRASQDVASEKVELASEVSRLRSELQRAQEEVDKRDGEARRSEQVRAAADDREMSAEVLSLVEERGFAANDGVGNLIDEILGLVQIRLDAERERVAEARTRENHAEIAKLNRRLGKLNSALSDTEAELQRVSRLKVGDEGISSIYREVQGLAADDTQFEKKKGLMSSIFEANLKLQKD